MPDEELEYITEEEVDRVTIYQPHHYRCPKHGFIDEQIFSSNIPDYDGKWCMRCIIDVLNANPSIHRVTDVPPDEEKN